MKSCMRGLLLLLVSLSQAPPLTAQQHFLNLDFEKPGAVQPHLPWGWRAANLPGWVSDATISLDTTTAHRGRRSLRLANGREPFVRVLRSVPATGSLYRGKSVHISTWIRSGGHSGLRLAARSNEDSAGVNLPATPEGEWTHHELVAPINPDAIALEIILTLTGKGVVWIDDLELRVDGVRVDSVALSANPTTSQLAWLQHNAVSLVPSDTAIAKIMDLGPLHSLMASAKVLAIGESTHGTKEYNLLWRDVTEYVTRHFNTQVVVLEESQLTAAALNQWVQGGSGDVYRILENGAYPMMRRAELIAMFEWIRQYNATAARKVDVVGIDAANVLSELDSVQAFLLRHDAAYSPVAQSNYGVLRALWLSRGWFGHTADSLKAWQDGAVRVLDHMRSMRPSYAAAVGNERADQMIRYAEAIHQGSMVLRYSGNDLIARDSIMAANMMRELSIRGPDTRAVLFAHSLHVGRLPRRMGEWLSKAMGDAYVPITTTSFDGHYMGSQPSSGGQHGEKVDVRIGPAPVGSFDEMLHRLGTPKLGVNLRAAVRDSAGAWLSDWWWISTSSARAVDFPFGFWPLSRYWDAVLFFDRTTAAEEERCRFVPVHRCWR